MTAYPKIQYFLGANAPAGFYSLYDQLIDREEAEELFILKGGPGCGKSSLMRRVGQAMDEHGLEVEYIDCSGDPDSLDAVVIPALFVPPAFAFHGREAGLLALILAQLRIHPAVGGAPGCIGVLRLIFRMFLCTRGILLAVQIFLIISEFFAHNHLPLFFILSCKSFPFFILHGLL